MNPSYFDHWVHSNVYVCVFFLLPLPQCVSRTGKQCDSNATIGEDTVKEGNNNEVHEKWVCTLTLTYFGQCINDTHACFSICYKSCLQNTWMTPTKPLNSELWSRFIYYPSVVITRTRRSRSQNKFKIWSVFDFVFYKWVQSYFIFWYFANDVSNKNSWYLFDWHRHCQSCQSSTSLLARLL